MQDAAHTPHGGLTWIYKTSGVSLGKKFTQEVAAIFIVHLIPITLKNKDDAPAPNMSAKTQQVVNSTETYTSQAFNIHDWQILHRL